MKVLVLLICCFSFKGLYSQNIFIKPSFSISPGIIEGEIDTKISKLFLCEFKVDIDKLFYKQISFYPTILIGMCSNTFVKSYYYKGMQDFTFKENLFVTSGLLGVQWSPGKKKLVNFYFEGGIIYNDYLANEYNEYSNNSMYTPDESITIINYYLQVTNSNNFGSIFKCGTNIALNKKSNLSLGLILSTLEKHKYNYDMAVINLDANFTYHKFGNNYEDFNRNPLVHYFYYNLGYQFRLGK